MEKDLRIKKIGAIIKDDKPCETGHKLAYCGSTKPMNAYKIPLECLIYNKYNGRIGSAVKSYEQEKGELNPEKSEDIKIIEEFLWKSNEERNKKTEDDLARITQREYGIISSDGKIINGNRRAMLLNKIYREKELWARKHIEVEHCKYLIAVILPQEVDDKDIQKLETEYQMGVDEKVDYNPIEKYLKCKDLENEYSFKPAQIANMMGEKESDIKKYLHIMKLMDVII